MKIYLDDVRDIPEGFVGCRTAEKAIELVKQGSVTFIDFDHDLGTTLTGYDVALYIEKQVHFSNITMPKWAVHSANPVGAKRIEQAMQAAKNTDTEKDPKIKCNRCKDTGIIEYFPLTGCTLYRWEKPKQRKCVCQRGGI